MIYSTSSHSASSTLKLGVDLVRSRETIHCPFGTGGRAIMHVAFGRVRRKIALLRTYPKIQNG